MPIANSPADASLACRIGCGACCIAPSISSPIPGMPDGKPAGVRCVQLTADDRCAIFGRPERPACCSGLRPSIEMCGESRAHAVAWLEDMEQRTRPQRTKLVVDVRDARRVHQPGGAGSKSEGRATARR